MLLAQRLRRWANIKLILEQRLVFAGDLLNTAGSVDHGRTQVRAPQTMGSDGANSEVVK